MPKYKVYWKALGTMGQRKQGHDIIEAESEGDIENIVDKEITGDNVFASELKIADAVNLFDAGCENWEITKIVPLDVPEQSGEKK